MRTLLILAAIALAVPVAAQSPQGVSGLDLGSTRVSGLDLGSSRTVDLGPNALNSDRTVRRFLVTPQQRALLMEHPEASGAVRPSGANHVVAARGYTFRGTPIRDGVADCTRRTTACLLVPDDPEAQVLILNRGR